jgi:tetratricopeptide (TPR) repeat protein
LFYLQWVCSRLEEGVTQARQAFKNDPLSAYALMILAFCLSTMKKHEEAIKQAQLATERDPDSFLGRWILANCYYYSGRLEESIVMAEEAAMMSGRHPFAISTMAIAHADLGKNNAARAAYEELLARSSRQFIAPTQLALTAYAAGEKDIAFTFMTRACDDRDPFLPLLAGWPPGRIREDPRFEEIRLRLHLPENDLRKPKKPI